MICKACLDANHSACDSRLCECEDCRPGLRGTRNSVNDRGWQPIPTSACQLCDGAGRDPEIPSIACSRCQGSGRELADLAGVDRVAGGHGGER